VYASRHLPRYLEDCRDDASLTERVQQLFDPSKSHNFTYFMLEHLYYHMIGHSTKDECLRLTKSVCPQDFSTLHAAAMLHLHEICDWLIIQSCDVNQMSSLGVPLECALYGSACAMLPPGTEIIGDLAVDLAKSTISVLLTAGAVCDKHTVHGYSLSYAAASDFQYGPESIFGVMLRHGMLVEDDTLVLFARGVDLVLEEFGEILASIEGLDTVPPELRMKLLNVAQQSHIGNVVSLLPSADTMTDTEFVQAVTYAVKFDHIDALNKLAIDGRFSVDMTQLGEAGTILHVAADNGSLHALHLLLDMGFDPAVMNQVGKTALHCVIAASIADEHLLYRLITREAANVADHEGRTAWHLSASLGARRVLEILIEKQGLQALPVQLQCSKGYTPILHAIIRGQSECALLLMDYLHADQNLFADDRILHYAVARGLHNILGAMQDCKVDLSTTSKDGRNALYYMTLSTTRESLELLRNCGLQSDSLDVLGRSPLVSFLARDARVDYLKLAHADDLESGQLKMTIIEELTTAFSVSAKDHDGHSAWFYFCTSMVPFILGLASQKAPPEYLTKLSSVLMRCGAINAYEDDTLNSGISLLSEACLNTADRSTIEQDDTNVRHAATILVPNANCVNAIRALLLDVLESSKTIDFICHPQTIRLLVWSVIVSDQSLIMKLLELGVNVHATSGHYDGFSSIDMAVAHNSDVKLLQILLKEAEVDRLVTIDGNGLIRYFSLADRSRPGLMVKNVTKLEALLETGIDPDKRSSNLETLAHVAAQSGRLEVLQLLVRFQAKLTMVDGFGWTVLQYAATRGDVAMLQFFRRHIIDDADWKTVFFCAGPLSGSKHYAAGPLPLQGYFGCTLLHLTALLEKPDAFEFLMGTKCFDSIDARSLEDVTPLHFAVCSETASTTKWLISNGADINATIGTKGITPLHIAFRLGRLETSLALVEAGAGFSVDSSGTTPEMAVHPDIRAGLVQRLPYCEVPIPSSVLDTLRKNYNTQSVGELHRAITTGDIEACRMIIQQGSSVTASLKECGSCTPLIVAIRYQKLDIAKLFLDHGASTAGIPCQALQKKGIMYASTLSIAVVQPLFNSVLDRLLNLTTRHEGHWSQVPWFQLPLHLAVAFNPKGINIIFAHIRSNATFFRYVVNESMHMQRVKLSFVHLLHMSSPWHGRKLI
jgi:ankyrin repeat protein